MTAPEPNQTLSFLDPANPRPNTSEAPDLVVRHDEETRAEVYAWLERHAPNAVVAAQGNDADARRCYLGASEIATVIGCHDWQTPREIALRKRGALPPEETSFAMMRGTVLEGLVLRGAAEKIGARVVPCSLRFCHPIHTFLAATPDAFAVTPDGVPVVIEAKTDSMFGEGADYARIAEHGPNLTERDKASGYWLQLQMQLEILDQEYGVIAVLGSIGEPEVYGFARAIEFRTLILPVLVQWWDRYVMGGEQPVARAADMARMPAPVVGLEAVSDDPALLALLREMDHLQAKKKTAGQFVTPIEKQIDDLKAQIRDAMGTAQILRAGPYMAKRTVVKGGTYTRADFERFTLKGIL